MLLCALDAVVIEQCYVFGMLLQTQQGLPCPERRFCIFWWLSIADVTVAIGLHCRKDSCLM